MPTGLVKSWVYLILAVLATAVVVAAAWRAGKTPRQRAKGLVLLYVTVPLWLGALELPVWGKILLLLAAGVPALCCMLPQKKR